MRARASNFEFPSPTGRGGTRPGGGRGQSAAEGWGGVPGVTWGVMQGSRRTSPSPSRTSPSLPYRESRGFERDESREGSKTLDGVVTPLHAPIPGTSDQLYILAYGGVGRCGGPSEASCGARQSLYIIFRALALCQGGWHAASTPRRRRRHPNPTPAGESKRRSPTDTGGWPGRPDPNPLARSP